MPPAGATRVAETRELTVDGVRVSVSVQAPSLGVNPQGKVKWALYHDGASLGSVWHCPDGYWRTWRGGTAHPTLEEAAAERLRAWRT